MDPLCLHSSRKICVICKIPPPHHHGYRLPAMLKHIVPLVLLALKKHEQIQTYDKNKYEQILHLGKIVYPSQIEGSDVGASL